MIAIHIIGALTLVWSGLAKLGTRESPAVALSGLDLPLWRPLLWGVRLFPVVEVSIGLCWLLAPLPWALASAGAGTVMYAAFTVIVVRAKRRKPSSECMCFGMRRPITRATVARNIVLAALGIMSTLLMVWSLMQERSGSVLDTIMEGFRSPDSVISVGVGVLLAAAYMVQAAFAEYTVSKGAISEAPVGPHYRNETTFVNESGEEVFVARSAPRTAFVDANGDYLESPEVAGERGSLVFFGQESCSLCQYVLAYLDEYRERVSPMGVVVIESNDGRTPPLIQGALADPFGMGSYRMGVSTVPAALVLLPNSTIPVGPVYGPDAIAELVDELEGVLRAAERSE